MVKRKKRNETTKAILAYLASIDGLPPTYSELCQHFNLSKGVIHHHIHKLIDAGNITVIELPSGQISARSIQVANEEWEG